MIRGLALALIGLAAPALAAAAELGVVTTVDHDLRMQFFMMNPPETEALLANYTARIEMGTLDAKLAAALPYGTQSVMYFAANGDLLAWSDKSANVEQGYWEVIDNGAFNEVCLRFGKFGVDSVCASPQLDNSEWLKELVEGNVFGLESGKSVPGALGADPFTLASIAGKH